MWRKHKKEKMNSNLTIACPKGRLEKKVVKYLADRGLEMEKAFFDDEIRKLTFDTNFKNSKFRIQIQTHLPNHSRHPLN